MDSGDIMNAIEKNRIISNEYADLIIDYNYDIYSYNVFPNVLVNRIDTNYAVVHIPVEYMTPNSIYKFNYSAIPSCFGVMSYPSFVPVPDLDIYRINQISDTPDSDLNGQGVLVGFVDTGIDYMNQVFKHKDNSSRIISIWDQTIDSENNYPYDISYGTEFFQEQINLALQSDIPLAIVPSTDDNGHGTMLAGIAAGSQSVENNFVGIAPDADFVIVKLKPAKQYLKEFFAIPLDAVCYQENDIMFGVNYLLRVAKQLKRPIAICIGVGTAQGAHGGRSKLSTYLANVGDKLGTVVVVAAGNEGNSGHHYYGEINNSVGFDIAELNVGIDEMGFTMEFWGNAPNTFTIDLYAPTGEYVSRIPAFVGRRQTIQITFKETSILVDNQTHEVVTGDQLIIYRFQNPMPGIWQFKIYGTGDLLAKFHIWLPINQFISKDTYFLKPNPYTTIIAPGNVNIPITMTAYNQLDNSLYYYASKGFTVLDEVKPDLAAPGVEIYCPTIGNQFVRSSGSSLAAAYTTGLAATMLEWGILKENLPAMNSVVIKRMLTNGAKRNPNIPYPNKEWGYGIVDSSILNLSTWIRPRI